MRGLTPLLRLFASAIVSGGAASAFTFTDVTEEVGINHTFRADLPSYDNDLEYSYMTGGAVAEDFNGDGWVDLYVIQGGSGPNLLYLNQAGVSFIEDASARGLALTAPFMGACAADYDSDGDIDIFLTKKKGTHLLLTNDGTGTFTTDDTTFQYPLNRVSSPSWVDLNGDGLLDLAMGAWNVSTSGRIIVYKNEGGGQFSIEQEIPSEWTFGAHFTDLNLDGFPDLVATADFGQTKWMFNNGRGVFLPGGSSDVENGMGVASADVDNDGDFDLFFSSIRDFDGSEASWGTTGNRLLENNGIGEFSDITSSAGVRDGYWGWGSLFADLDNDGDQDLYHVNGWPAEESSSPAQFNDKPAVLFENQGAGAFAEVAGSSGDADNTGQGRCVVSFDFDNDGDLDLYIANNSELVDDGAGGYNLLPGPPVFLRNDSPNAGNWLKVELSGAYPTYHSHGMGARVVATIGDVSQTKEINASTNFNGHGPYRIVHFGAGEAARFDSVGATFQNGDEIWVNDIEVNQNLILDSPSGTLSARSVEPGGSIDFQISAEDIPADSEVVWTYDGVDHANPATIAFPEVRSHLVIAKVYPTTGNMDLIRGERFTVHVVDPATEARSIAQIWNEETLDAIRMDFPAPTTHSRNLFHLSVAMWDAWCAYGSGPELAYLHREVQVSGDVESARREAISYAAFRLLGNRYQNSVNGSTTTALINQLMLQLGYDPDFVSTEGDSPAALGNRVAETVLEYYSNDGADDPGSFLDGEYSAANGPLTVAESSTTMADPNRWQPLLFEDAFTQNGQPTDLIQTFVGPNWGAVRPFALGVPEVNGLYHDPGPPPELGGAEDGSFKEGNVEVVRHSSLLDPVLLEEIDISPGSWGNNTLGFNDGTGRGFNPITGQPYTPQIVKHADFGRVLAEFWADGPDSETPPGHWNVLANELHEHPDFVREYRGQGIELDRLEWDVKVYLGLNGALHDAAIAAWGCKRVYDYVRPICSIRHMAKLGQSSDPGGPSYHADGIPLSPDLIEVITPASVMTGERHEHLAAHVGKIAIYAWSPNAVEEGQPGSVDWMLADDWLPYQRSTFVTPAFPGYVSGHSTFSRAAAEVLTFMTGSAFFPGGLGSFTAEKDKYLHFEPGPSEDVVLQWATYYDAADQAGISRLYGGIHVPVDDGPGRIIGAKCGLDVCELAAKYFDGSIVDEPMSVRSVQSADGEVGLTWDALRGFYYVLESSSSLGGFTEAGPWMRSEEMIGEDSSPITEGASGYLRVRREPSIPEP